MTSLPNLTSLSDQSQQRCLPVLLTYGVLVETELLFVKEGEEVETGRKRRGKPRM
ncbi:hypothetical protein EXN66_Car003900 [Channa argus]|uniref:Uncharacterized protein n=1 Tax=Channa argus TaxID=215402 RepID=A0A6G1PDY3_CHAAH|nr:hypothetical protein EXN66_Car003900 [Channa argus]